MADDKLVFTISWAGTTTARLHYIIDNDKVVATEQDNLEGNGLITYQYTRTRAAVHVLEWSLWFPGKTASKLVAKVSINGGAGTTLDTKKDDTKNKWASRGAAP